MPQSQNKKGVVGQLALSLHDLFDELFQEGFREIYSPRFQLRAAELLNHLQADASLKYALASLICHSAEDQEKFYRVFDAFLARHKPSVGELPPLPVPEASKPSQITDAPDTPSTISAPQGGILPDHEGERVPDLAAAARSGPITIELRFRDDGFRPWNLPELEPALRPFREKEWASSEDWDIPASIQKTIRGGGVPNFVRKQKRCAPQYLFLIQQKSVRDHLAAFYADLVKELLRRDVDADFYFYGDEPTRCWRDRRSPASFTTLDRLYPSHKNSRLVLIGEPTGLLKPLRIYPAELAFELRESWREVALLNTRSTALWGAEEETLCRLFPVAPANIAGFGSLYGQWQSRQSYTPAHWKTEQAESVPTNLKSIGNDPEWVSKTLQNLKVYLGKYGITWLCAICVYPEIYWQMTKILHDEAISPVDVPEETRRNQIWHNALLQLSRLDWLRQGNIPPEFRQKLRNLLPAANAIEVRKELLRMLNWDENVARDKDSYAYQDREYTIALLQHEQVLKSQPTITEAEKARLDASFRERLDQQGITVSDIADAVGREIFKKMVLPSSKAKAFRVLWVDDFPENNAYHIESIKKTLEIEFELAKSTGEALDKIQNQTFDAIISDLGRGEDEWAGLNLLKALKTSSNQTPVAIFAAKRAVENRTMLLQEGAQLATNSFGDVDDWIRRLMVRESKEKDPGFWVLWIDDRPETDANFQEEMAKLFSVRFVNTTDTQSALEALSKQTFDLIISDLERGKDLRGGVDTLKIIREKGHKTPAAIFTRSKFVDQFREELAALNVSDILSNRDAQRAYLERFITGNQRQKSEGIHLETLVHDAAKAVCRVMLPNGRMGTGFLTKDGYLFTCNHVIESPEMAKDAQVEFNFEKGDSGLIKVKVTYNLDALDFVFSPTADLNFTRVKIIDQKDEPLSQWGYIELETSQIPLEGDRLSIVHHPEGSNKVIEINVLEVLGQIRESIYYTPNTRPGSSGAPILNINAKAVAMHRQRRTGEGNNFVVNEKGDRRDASQGVLFRDILAYMEESKKKKAVDLGDHGAVAAAAAKILEEGDQLLAGNHYEKAVEKFQEALGYSRSVKDKNLQGQCLTGLGKSFQGWGNLSAARLNFEKAYDLYSKSGDKRNQSESLKLLSRVSRQIGELSKAKAYLQTALRIDQMIGNWGFTMHEMGEINEAMGDLEDAEKNYREALETLEEEINDDRAWVDTQEALGRLAFKRGDTERAWGYFQQVSRTLEESSDQGRQANILAVLAEIELKRNNLAQATRYAQRASSIYIALNDKENEVRVEGIFKSIETYARQREESNNPPIQQQETAQSQSGSMQEMSEDESPLELALAKKKTGKEAMGKGQIESAREAFKAAIDLFKGVKDEGYDQADIVYELALLEKSAGNTDLALSLFERAYGLFAPMGHQGTLDAINGEIEGLLKLEEEKKENSLLTKTKPIQKQAKRK
ncbi:MAG: tetratricopeptide repeat protein [Saprospiraceae bacterium]|nr:tetratricopeptide repeat protein [Saprospiraceae bacterium]